MRTAWAGGRLRLTTTRGAPPAAGVGSGGGSAVGAPLGIEVLAAALNADAGELTDVGAVAGSTGKSQELATSGSSGRTD